jgi:nitrate/TMAO reductase-like tetraheme cytochrome c subunit
MRRIAFSLLLLTMGPGHAANAQDQPADPGAAATCGVCHTEIYQEWRETLHAKAWTDPVYQAALKEQKRPELCHKCHIPESVLDRAGRQPIARETRKDEGITCVSCHEQKGTIHGPFGAKTDAHPSEKDVLFTPDGAITLCKSCHDTKIGPVLRLAKTFEDSGLRKEGKSCIGCHMPEVERPIAIQVATGKPAGPARKGRSHRINTPEDPKFLATAFSWSVAEQDGELVFTVQNEAGHQIPGLTLRTFKIRFQPLDDGGKPAGEGGEIVFSDENPLNAREQREAVKLKKPAGASKASMRIEYLFDGKPRHEVEGGTKQL